MTRNTDLTASQKGFTLLELLLVVGISAMLLVGISQITRAWVNAETAENAGQHMARVSGILEKYIEANWSTLGGNEADVLVAGQAAGNPWEDFVARLNQEGLLNGGALRSPIGVPLRISYIRTVSGGEDLYRATIMSTENVANEQALNIARKSGTYGGTVSFFTGANTAASAYGQWNLNTNELTSAAFPCAPTQRRSCIVATTAFSEQSLRGPYLYRTNLGDDEFNTMQTNLLMNNNNIENAANIGTEDLTVSNTASLGNTAVNGPATLNGGANVSGIMTVNSDANITGNMGVDGNMNINGAGGLTTPQLNTPLIQTDTISTTRLSADNINVQGEMLIRENLVVQGDLRAEDTISATEMNIGDATVSGEIRSGSIDITNTMNISGAVTIVGGGNLVADRLVTDGCVSLNDGAGNMTNYGVCP